MLNQKLILKSSNHVTLPYRGLQFLSLFLLFFIQWLVAPLSAATVNVSAVGQLSLVNPETGSSASCSATLIAPSRVVTVASCVLSEETRRQAQSARVCFRQDGQRSCYNSKKILTHSGYLQSNNVNDANNLAYIELDRTVRGIQPVKEFSPQQFEDLLKQDIASLKTIWVGYDSRGISSRLPIKKSHLELSGLEYDYLNRRLNLQTAEILPGQHYEGTAILLEDKGQRYLLGMISSTFPDEIVHYYPEINPCDEDPVIVRYPKPIIRSDTKITVYPVAACGMNGFQSARGFNELKCIRLARRTSLDNAV